MIKSIIAAWVLTVGVFFITPVNADDPRSGILLCEVTSENFKGVGFDLGEKFLLAFQDNQLRWVLENGMGNNVTCTFNGQYSICPFQRRNHRSASGPTVPLPISQHNRS
jgi:hypothetical protein